jgi:dimethylargininase
VDVATARQQHDAYLALLASHNLDIIHAPDADGHPDGLFVEDALVMVDDLAIITRPGAPSRRGEIDSMRLLVEQLGLRHAAIIEPGTLDGGDVLVTDRHVFIGQSSRTNDLAIAQFASLVDRPVVGVPVTRCLHLKSAITALPDGSLIAVDEWVDTTIFADLGYIVRIAPDDTGGDVLFVGSTVILPLSAEATAQALRSWGFTVQHIDVGELQKIEAGVTCMSVLL